LVVLGGFGRLRLISTLCRLFYWGAGIGGGMLRELGLPQKYRRKKGENRRNHAE
jgi:hypothetical protein